MIYDSDVIMIGGGRRLGDCRHIANFGSAHCFNRSRQTVVVVDHVVVVVVCNGAIAAGRRLDG